MGWLNLPALLQDYPLLKTVHIISATFLWGTGVGTAFFMLLAHLGGDIATIRTTTRHVVLADWCFTLPSIIVQPLTGLLLMRSLHISLQSRWFLVVFALYLLVCLCWLPVVWIQLRLRDLAQTLALDDVLPPVYRHWFITWVLLGIPAALAMLTLFALMVYKPWMS